MSKIKTNERELASNVAHWFNEHIERNDFPFTSATNETGIATGETTRFGDIVIWRDRNAGSAYSYIELKPPTGSKENLETFRQKAIALNVTYAYTWNFQSLNVYKVEKGKITLLDSHSTPIFLSIEESKQGDKQAIIRTHIMRICADLV
ncbi:MAG TPA: hypothetical protein PLD84_15255, partial [Chitinophagales bacterium]|nr:hypothetical protein [Chitinophagales bacterium]